jgi:hypothetical protein
MLNDHPAAFGSQHPWLDPLGPQDIFNARPDAELAMAGGFAPDPQDFPFTPAGRAEYYEAVRTAAHQMQMTQMQAMRAQAMSLEADHRAAREADEQRQAVFLLLSP